MYFLFLIPPLIVVALIGLVVWAIVSWRRRAADAAPDPGIGTSRRLYFYVVSLAALMMAVNGLVQVVRFLLDSQFGPDVITASSTGLAVGVSLIIVGFPLWAFHWRLIQRHVAELPVERRSVLRKGYIYVVLGVAVALVIVALVDVLRWLFGGQPFDGYHWAVAIVWPAVWAFHWRIESAEGQPSEETRSVRRLYLYLTSLVGLAMLAVGAFRIVGFILLEGYDALLSVPVILPNEASVWRPAMQSVVSLALVGGATWALHWLFLARADFGSALRQIYVYVFAVLGGVIATLVALGFLIFGALAWLLGVPSIESATDHFRFLPAAVAGLSVGIALWAYHWAAVRGEAGAYEQEALGAERAYAYILSALGLGALVVAVGVLVNTALATLIESSRPLVAGEDLWREPIALSIALAILGGFTWGYFWTGVQRRVSARDASERSSAARRVFIFAALGAGMLALLGSFSALLFVFLRDLLDEGVATQTFRDAKPALDILVAVAVFLPYHWLVYRQDRREELEDEQATEPQPFRPPRKDVTVLAADDAAPLVGMLETALGYSVSVRSWADSDAHTPQLTPLECDELAARIAAAAGRSVLVIPEGEGVRALSYS